MNSKMDRAVSKKTAHKSTKRRRKKKDGYQLWRELFDENLKKNGYIK